MYILYRNFDKIFLSMVIFHHPYYNIIWERCQGVRELVWKVDNKMGNDFSCINIILITMWFGWGAT